MPSTRRKTSWTAEPRGHVWRCAAVKTLWTCLLVVSWHCPAGVLGDNSSSSITPYTSASSTVAPSPTSPSPSFSSSSPHPSPTSLPPTPTPTPPVSKPFLNYMLSGKLHLMIQTINIFIYTGEGEGYYNLTEKDYPALESQPSHQVANVSSYQLNFTKQYFYNNTGSFVFTFILKQEPSSTDQMWYISSFTHRNRTATDHSNSSDVCSFSYSGMSAVHAPSDLTYFCSGIGFRGDCVDSEIKSEVQFSGLFIQAFQTPSSKSTYVDCGAKDHNNSIVSPETYPYTP
ncbi:hypothetical protein GBAR_LOCUS14860, partial [Geodia barretti]